jgi:hypothetical protein
MVSVLHGALAHWRMAHRHQHSLPIIRQELLLQTPCSRTYLASAMGVSKLLTLHPGLKCSTVPPDCYRLIVEAIVSLVTVPSCHYESFETVHVLKLGLTLRPLEEQLPCDDEQSCLPKDTCCGPVVRHHWELLPSRARNI